MFLLANKMATIQATRGTQRCNNVIVHLNEGLSAGFLGIKK